MTFGKKMKMILRTALLLAAMGLVGCGDKKSRSFFAPSGVFVGSPVMVEAGAYRIPIKFETEIVHSGQWIDTVQAEVDGSDIQVTAVFTHANRESRYPGYIEVSRARPGVYALQYQDPDGTLHLIELVSLP